MSALRSLSSVGLLPPKLFLSCLLKAGHAVFECLDLALTRPPVLVFCHALLHSIMQLCAASAGYHPVHRVFLVLVFAAAVVR